MSGTSYLTILIPIAGADAPSDVDNGYGSDSADEDNFRVSITDTDTGTSVEGGHFVLEGSDTGTGTDVGSLTYGGSDSGTGTDAGFLTITSSDSDTTVTELGAITGISFTEGDTGTATDESHILRPRTTLATGIMSKVWLADIENKWTTTTTKRWRARMVDSVDQIS